MQECAKHPKRGDKIIKSNNNSWMMRDDLKNVFFNTCDNVYFN